MHSPSARALSRPRLLTRLPLCSKTCNALQSDTVPKYYIDHKYYIYQSTPGSTESRRCTKYPFTKSLFALHKTPVLMATLCILTVCAHGTDPLVESPPFNQRNNNRGWGWGSSFGPRPSYSDPCVECGNGPGDTWKVFLCALSAYHMCI